jgi:hypothetical protein
MKRSKADHDIFHCRTKFRSIHIESTSEMRAALMPFRQSVKEWSFPCPPHEGI